LNSARAFIALERLAVSLTARGLTSSELVEEPLTLFAILYVDLWLLMPDRSRMDEDRRRHKETDREECSRHSGSRLNQSVFNILNLHLGSQFRLHALVERPLRFDD
jgi:hypothetical protein